MLQAGSDSRSVQELLVYAEVATTMIKTHVLQMGGGAQTAGLVVQHLGAANLADTGWADSVEKPCNSIEL